MANKASCHGRALDPIAVDESDFPALPAAVPPGLHFEGDLARAQWEFWTAKDRPAPGWADRPDVRGWSDTVLLDLQPQFEPTQPGFLFTTGGGQAQC